MKHFALICVLLVFVTCSIQSAAYGGQAMDELVAATQGQNCSVIFDGATEAPVSEMEFKMFSGGDLGRVPNRSYGAAYVPPIVEAVESSDKARVNDGMPLDEAAERPYLLRAIEKLGAVRSGKDLAAFLNSEGVETKWKVLDALESEPNDAEACGPDVCGKKKVIYLNNTPKYKKIFLDPNPTFLAVTLAHELMHLSDFKQLNGVPERKSQAHFFLELNGYSAGLYVYHQLLISGVAPKPNSPEESFEMQNFRLSLAIRDYINGGSYPDYRDFNRIAAPPSFDYYVGRVSNGERKGSMSLAGVVEALYGFDSDIEVLQRPSLFASGKEKDTYQKAKKIKRSLDLSTAGYIKWRKETVGVPPQENPGHYHDTPNDGGGDDGGAIGVDPGDWHPTPGSGQATWD